MLLTLAAGGTATRPYLDALMDRPGLASDAVPLSINQTILMSFPPPQTKCTWASFVLVMDSHSIGY